MAVYSDVWTPSRGRDAGIAQYRETIFNTKPFRGFRGTVWKDQKVMAVLRIGQHS